MRIYIEPVVLIHCKEIRAELPRSNIVKWERAILIWRDTISILSLLLQATFLMPINIRRRTFINSDNWHYFFTSASNATKQRWVNSKTVMNQSRVLCLPGMSLSISFEPIGIGICSWWHYNVTTFASDEILADVKISCFIRPCTEKEIGLWLLTNINYDLEQPIRCINLLKCPSYFFATIIPIVRLSLKDSPLSSRTESKAHTRNICIQSLSFGNYKRKNVYTIYVSLELTTKAFINKVVYILTMFFMMIIRGLGNEFCGNTSLLSHDRATPG